MLAFGLVLALSAIARGASPTITLDTATVTGIPSTSNKLHKFLGIPFAEAPRFELPIPVGPYEGSVNATVYGTTCPTQMVIPPPKPFMPRSAEYPDERSQVVLAPSVAEHPQGEDCLSINVIKPATAAADAGLPVVVWIFGGGFQGGDTVGFGPWSERVIERSIAMEKPVIWVSMNYRSSAYGFLASQEIADEGTGNFGLVDQRVALRWVKKYINAFGGDSTKVTLWGQSAGAMSASLQMLAYGGETEGLFRAAFLQSGSPIPVGSILNGQSHYDQLVEDTECTGESDTLACLRGVSFETLQAAVAKSPTVAGYTGLSLPWSPRVDGVFLQEPPYEQITSGRVPSIPVVSGNMDDEGTLFSMAQTNLTDDAKFRTYVSTVFAKDASPSELVDLWTNYTTNQDAGSPYDTPGFNEVYPQFKRLASFQGDLVFQAPRRNFLNHLSGKQDLWSYQCKLGKLTPYLGAYHGNDLNVHVTDDYIINFVRNLDPNTGSGTPWPKYTTATRQLLNFRANLQPNVISDTFRQKGMEYLINLASRYPL